MIQYKAPTSLRLRSEGKEAEASLREKKSALGRPELRPHNFLQGPRAAPATANLEPVPTETTMALWADLD